MEKTKIMSYTEPPAKLGFFFGVPPDIGNEQLLLGCHASARSKDGKDFATSVKFIDVKSSGNRYAEVVVEPCPAEVTVSIKLVLLLPPSLTNAQQQALTKSLLAKTSSAKAPRKSQEGFPEPEFTDGGPAFVNAQPGRNPYQTMVNVMTKARGTLSLTFDQKFTTVLNNQFMDPAVIKTTKQGACMQLSRLTEKSFAGVARAVYAVAFIDELDPKDLQRVPRSNDYPGFGHALLLVEDPETGKYLLADLRGEPYIGPHPGHTIIDGVLPRQDEEVALPSKFTYKLFKRDTRVDVGSAFAKDPPTKVGNIEYTASSRAGKDMARFQNYLKNAPPDFADLAKKLNAAKK